MMNCAHPSLTYEHQLERREPTPYLQYRADGRSSATTLIMNGLEFGGQELSKRPDMIGQSSGHARGAVAPLGLDQS